LHSGKLVVSQLGTCYQSGLSKRVLLVPLFLGVLAICRFDFRLVVGLVRLVLRGL
jgi:hypothetical protein